MNILVIKDICWDICLHRMLWSSQLSFWFPSCSDKSTKFNGVACTLSGVWYFACHWWYKLFVHRWMKGIYFASFHFPVCDLTRDIRENKNLTKISTYTVFKPFSHPGLSLVRSGPVQRSLGFWVAARVLTTTDHVSYQSNLVIPLYLYRFWQNSCFPRARSLTDLWRWTL